LLLLHCDSFGQRFYTLIACPVFGEHHTVFGDGVAFYQVTTTSLEYVDVCDHTNTFNENSRAEEFFLKNPLFTRTEQVNGHKTFVLRNDHQDNWTEDYYALPTGFYALKRVEVDKKTGVQTVEEITSLDFRPLNSDEQQWPNLPKSFAQVEQRIAALQNSGSSANRSHAVFVRQNVEKVKHKLGVR
jgi:hypothetical protein